MRYLTCFAVTALAVGTSLCAPPTITLPKQVTVSPGRIAEVDASGDFKNAIWEIKYGVGEDGKLIKPSGVDLKVPSEDGKKAYFASVTPGEYVLSVTAGNADGISKSEVVITVPGQGAPNPFPNPSPNPTPPPGPTAKNVYIAILRDPMNVSPQLSAVIGDTAFWDDLVKGGSDWDSYTNSSETAVKKGYVKKALEVQADGAAFAAAMVILAKDTGKVLKVVKLPETKEAIRAILAEVKK